MNPFYIIVAVGVIFILIVIVIIALIPSDEKKKKRKEKEEAVRQKDWENAAQGFERKAAAFKKQADELFMKRKELEENLLKEQKRIKELEEKLSQQVSWQQKEQDELEKKTGESRRLKEDILKTQENFANEHTMNLRLEKELKLSRQKEQELTDLRRSLESENQQLKAQLVSARNDISQLQKENTELKKKRDDTAWVAKTEYEKLKQILKEKEAALEKMRAQS